MRNRKQTLLHLKGSLTEKSLEPQLQMTPTPVWAFASNQRTSVVLIWQSEFWTHFTQNFQFHNKNKLNATAVYIKKFIFLQFLVSKLTHSISLRIIHFILKTFNLFRKSHRLQYQNKLHSDFRVFQHKTWLPHVIHQSVNTRDRMDCQQFQSKLKVGFSGFLLGAPYCSRWGNHCSVFFKNPTKQCKLGWPLVQWKP